MRPSPARRSSRPEDEAQPAFRHDGVLRMHVPVQPHEKGAQPRMDRDARRREGDFLVADRPGDVLAVEQEPLEAFSRE